MVEVVLARGVGGLLATSKDDLVDSSKACFFLQSILFLAKNAFSCLLSS